MGAFCVEGFLTTTVYALECIYPGLYIIDWTLGQTLDPLLTQLHNIYDNMVTATQVTKVNKVDNLAPFGITNKYLSDHITLLDTSVTSL